MKQLKLIILLISFLVGAPFGVSADSLWSPSQSFYSPNQRKIQVGDVITVQISESTTAAQQATTQTNKQSGISADFLQALSKITNLLGNQIDRENLQYDIGGEEDYRGTGQTSRRSNVRARVTATVTEILETGNIYLVGEHNVKVNNEIQTIRISGIVRPQDVSPLNTIYSYQLAKAQVSIIGEGVVNQKQNPGLLTRMFGWLF